MASKDGTLNFEDLNKLSESTRVKIENKDKVVCISRLENMNNPFPSEGSRAKGLLELIHSDVCGLMEVQSLGGSNCFVTSIDNYFRKVFVYLIKTSQMSLINLKNTKPRWINQLYLLIKKLRTDNGREYLSNENKSF